MINKEPKSYGIIVTTLITIGVILIIGLSLKNIDMEYEERTSCIPPDKNVLAVGQPKYITHEGESKYSQINIKNTSNHTLYNIWIDLEQQEMNEKSTFLVPSYTLTSLKPGESAVLSYEHNDLKENQALTIDSYTYMDGNGKQFKVNNTKTSDTDNPNTYIETTKKEFKYETLTNDIDKITIENTEIVESNGKNYLKIDLKNNSEVDLKDVNLTFKEYNNGIVIGENTQNVSTRIAPKEKATISVEISSDTNLELEQYVYSIDDDSNKEKYNKVYSVFVNEEKYHLEEYVDSELERRITMIFLGSNVIVLGICGILDKYCSRLEKKGALEEDIDYNNKARIVKIISQLIYMIYIGLLIYVLLYNKI
ncbi:MAG: FxLYD domain-containing protein [Peptostreptococcaceae bacterium]